MAVEALAEASSLKEGLERFLLVTTIALGVATLPQVLQWVRQIPYTLLLVIVGSGLALVDVRLVNLSPELILTLFLPPLLFEAGWNLKWRDLRHDLGPILLFALVGVGISLLVVGMGLWRLAGFPLLISLLVGASLSATDPISVIALFRELGVKERLKTLMEGESLFNDGVAVVAFSLLISLMIGTEGFSLRTTTIQFVAFVGIGTGIGLLIGFGISYLTQRFDLPLVEQSLTLIAAYGTYLLGESLGGSGVIAVVMCGLILGNYGSRIGMNPRTRLIVSEFWEFVAFLVNSIVFLLIGDQMRFSSLEQNLAPIAITIAAMIAARVLVIFGLSWFSNTALKSGIGFREQTVLWWGGLRGSVTIALALSLPMGVEQRDTIITTIFGVVLFTLLVQGLTIKPLLQRLQLLGDQPLQQRYQELQARQAALTQVLNQLNKMEVRPDVEPEFYRYQMSLIEGELKNLREELAQLTDEYPQLREYAVELVRQELLSIEANVYAEFVQTGRLNQELAPFMQRTLAGEPD
ncbi:MAG: Na+/H+ antiporter [Synechococcaceae cyanobacterium SM2_3_1]|nr:Na+/H+ antiporter [Synechococcaceae cyanobacterium SM2_3_1]